MPRDACRDDRKGGSGIDLPPSTGGADLYMDEELGDAITSHNGQGQGTALLDDASVARGFAVHEEASTALVG